MGGAAARPECAYACSCAPVDAKRDLPRADAAIVGRLLFKEDEDSGTGVAKYVFAVERVVKGQLGSRVEITSGADGAAWALLVLALASIAAFAATSEPIEVPRRHVERHNSRDGARTRLDETDRAHRDRG